MPCGPISSKRQWWPQKAIDAIPDDYTLLPSSRLLQLLPWGITLGLIVFCLVLVFFWSFKLAQTDSATAWAVSSLSVRALLRGRSGALLVFHSNSVSKAVFVWARGAPTGENGGCRPGQSIITAVFSSAGKALLMGLVGVALKKEKLGFMWSEVEMVALGDAVRLSDRTISDCSP